MSSGENEVTEAQLRTVSDENLKGELARRERERLREEAQVSFDTLTSVLGLGRDFLELVPHTRGSCKGSDNSGFHPGHGGVGCPRCYLESLYSCGHSPPEAGDSDAVFFALDVTATRRTNWDEIWGELKPTAQEDE